MCLALLTVATLAGCSPSRSLPTWVNRLGYRPEELFAVRVGRFGYPFVRVVINGVSRHLAFDTGNMTGLLLSPRLVEELHLQVTGSSRHRDSAGQVVAVADVCQVELKAFGTAWGVQPAHVFATEVAGLIGPRYLLEQRFTLDYLGGVLAVSGSALPPAADGVRLPMIRSPRHQALILVEGTVNGSRTTIELDTGKSRTVVDSELAQRLALPAATSGLLVDEIVLGSLHLSVPSAKPKSYSGISTGLATPIGLGLGSDLLSQIILSVDYRTGEVLLQVQPGTELPVRPKAAGARDSGK